MDNIMLAKDVKIENLVFGAPKVLDNGGKFLGVSYKKRPLIIQTPEMYAPFGMNKYELSETNVKYSLNLSFGGKQERPALQKFYSLLEDLDKHLVKEGLKSSQLWFKKKYSSLEVVEALYTPLLKHPKDKDTGEITDKYPATFRLNVPHKDGEFGCDVYNNKKELVDLHDLETKGSRVTAIIQCTGVWVAGGKFGCSWKIVQMRVCPKSGVSGYSFKEVEDERIKTKDDDEERPTTGYVEESEEEEDDEGDDVY